jgi:predicted Zn finger-like uncharacterized protein
VVVGCPKCKAKLNIPDEKIAAEGTKFKCPKCATVLMVKKPVGAPAGEPAAAPPGEEGPRQLDKRKILIAHADAGVLGSINAVLSRSKHQLFQSNDGVETLVNIMKEMPFLIIVDAALPKISGFEVARRIRSRNDTKPMKVILVTSKTDQQRVQKKPASAYGVDAYIDDDEIEQGLLASLYDVLGIKPKEQPAAPQSAGAPSAAAPVGVAPADDPGVAKAKRLARTVLSDIDLYSPDKVLDAIRTGQFSTVFAEDLREGLKHYESRIPAEVRAKGNFFQEAIDDFLAKKQKILGL